MMFFTPSEIVQIPSAL